MAVDATGVTFSACNFAVINFMILPFVVQIFDGWHCMRWSHHAAHECHWTGAHPEQPYWPSSSMSESTKPIFGGEEYACGVLENGKTWLFSDNHIFNKFFSSMQNAMSVQFANWLKIYFEAWELGRRQWCFRKRQIQFFLFWGCGTPFPTFPNTVDW